jgi:hypothetical protein
VNSWFGESLCFILSILEPVWSTSDSATVTSSSRTSHNLSQLCFLYVPDRDGIGMQSVERNRNRCSVFTTCLFREMMARTRNMWCFRICHRICQTACIATLTCLGLTTQPFLKEKYI